MYAQNVQICSAIRHPGFPDRRLFLRSGSGVAAVLIVPIKPRDAAARTGLPPGCGPGPSRNLPDHQVRFWCFLFPLLLAGRLARDDSDRAEEEGDGPRPAPYQG
jgi:hypothetical protein